MLWAVESETVAVGVVDGEVVFTPGFWGWRGFDRVAVDVLGAVLTAAGIDVCVVRVMRRRWMFPSGACITGLLVAMVLSPQEPWYIPIATSALAISSKQVLKIGRRPIFNPAALGLLVASLVFSSGQSWWGAVARLSPWWILLLLVIGYLVSDRVNKFPQVLAFLGSYFLLFTLAVLMGNSTQLAEIFTVPFLNAALFFAFIMLTDPPTSPAKYEEQMQFGGAVALMSFLYYLFFGGVSFLLVGLLFGNGLIALERLSASSEQESRERGLPNTMGFDRAHGVQERDESKKKSHPDEKRRFPTGW